jgi:hypothetical protein
MPTACKPTGRATGENKFKITNEKFKIKILKEQIIKHILSQETLRSNHLKKQYLFFSW